MDNIAAESTNDTEDMKEKVRVVRLDDPTIPKSNIGLGDNANASVWSLCDINNDDSHVDLGDITPSISRVFTEEQVLEFTEQQMVDPMTHRLLDDGDNMFSNIERSLDGGRRKSSSPLHDFSDLEIFDSEMKKMGALDAVDAVTVSHHGDHINLKELDLGSDEERSTTNKTSTTAERVENVALGTSNKQNIGRQSDSVSVSLQKTTQRRSPRMPEGSPESGMSLRRRTKRPVEPVDEKREDLKNVELEEVTGTHTEQGKKTELDKDKKSPSRRSSRIAKHVGPEEEEEEEEEDVGAKDDLRVEKQSNVENTSAPLPSGKNMLTKQGENLKENEKALAEKGKVKVALQESVSEKVIEPENKVQDANASVAKPASNEKDDDSSKTEIHLTPGTNTPKSTPGSPEKRVTRSTTGNLKPKQSFYEMQEKQDVENARKLKEKAEESEKLKAQNEGDSNAGEDMKWVALGTDSDQRKAELKSNQSPKKNKQDDVERGSSHAKKENEKSGSKLKGETMTKILSELSEEPRESGSESSDEEVDFHDDDSDYSPEDDPSRLWCICRKPHGNRFMICCDGCEEWFHGKCVGITMEQGRKMEKGGKEYVCTKCKEKRAKVLLEEKERTEPVKTAEKPPFVREVYKNTRQNQKEVAPPVAPDVKCSGSTPSDVKRSSSTPPDVKPSSSTPSDVKPSSSTPSDAKPSSSTAPSSEPEEKKRKPKEHAGFKIPKKVRTTPTPASHVHQPTRKCVAHNCPRSAVEGAVYCGKSCIERHVSQAVKMLSGKEHGGKPLMSEGNRVAVIEKSSGRVIAGMAAPVMNNLMEWILRNPSFQVLLPGATSTSHSNSSFYNKPTTETKVKKEVDRKSEVETIRSNVRRTMKEILLARKKESSDIRISVDEILKLVSTIEEGMHKAFKDTSHRYKARYRTLMFNLKDPRNKVLYRRVLTGDIPPGKLIWMTTDELATKELAEWREQETKHMIDMIKKEEENTNKARLIKKTHKGEVDMDGGDDFSTLAETPNTKEESDEGTKSENEAKQEILLTDTTEEHRAHLFDLNCKICTGKMAPPGEVVAKSPQRVASSVPVQAAAESSIPSPPREVTIVDPPSPDSAEFATISSNVKVPSDQKEKSVWKGFVMMQSVAKFGTNAYLVSGSADDLIQVLPDTLHVHGRIAHEQVWDYVFQCKTSSTREMCLIRFAAATDEEKISYVSLYSYFHSRKRCGVIGNCYSGVKDMYLIPLAAYQPVPPELLPFKGPGLQEPRPHMLLGLIIRSKVGVGKRARSSTDRVPSTERGASASPRGAGEPPAKQRANVNGTTDASKSTPPHSKSTTPTLPDSPVDEIEDIVFHFHNSQAKLESEAAKPQPSKAQPSKTQPSSTQPLEPMVSTFLKLQEQERKIRALQEQSERLQKEMAPQKATLPASISSVLSRLASSMSSRVDPIAAITREPEKSSSTVVDPSSLYDPETAYDEETPYDPEDLDLSVAAQEGTSSEGTGTSTNDIVKPSGYDSVPEVMQKTSLVIDPAIVSVLPALAQNLLQTRAPESEPTKPGAGFGILQVVDTQQTDPRSLLDELFAKRNFPTSSDGHSRNIPSDPRSSRFRNPPAQDASQSRDVSETKDLRQLSDEPRRDVEESKLNSSKSRPSERRWSDDKGRDRNDRPRDDRPRDDRPREDRPRDDRPREDRPRDDRPREDRPRDDRPRDDRPRDDRPRDDRPRDDRSRDERQWDDRSRDDRQRDDRQRGFSDRDRSYDRDRHTRDKWRR